MPNSTRKIWVIFVLILMVSISGCMGTENRIGAGNQNTDEASISFSEEQSDIRSPVYIAIQVESLGGYDFIWVKPDGVEGGYQINRSSAQPVLYISNDGLKTTAFGVCYKDSLTEACGFYSGDPTEFNPSVKIYGVKDGKKTLVDKYSLTAPTKRVSYSK